MLYYNSELDLEKSKYKGTKNSNWGAARLMQVLQFWLPVFMEKRK